MERRLNIGENFLWTGGTDSFSIAVSVTLRGEIAVDAIREAIKKARQKHPLMGVRVALDQEKNPWFVSEGVPDCPLRIVDRKSDEDAAQEIKNELAIPFAWEVGPLVRFALVRSAEVTDLIAVCHHCVADGIATAILVRDIMSFLLFPDQKIEVMPDQPALEELIPDFVKAALPLPKKSHEPEQDRFLKLAPADVDAMHHDPNFPTNKGNLHFHSWELGEENTAALLARCHQEAVRVHSALCAAFGLSGAFKSIANAVNLRNRLTKPIGDRFGTFATTIYASLRLRPGQGLWEAARHYQKQFERHLKNLNGWVMLLPAMPASFKHEFQREPVDVEKSANALIISNVGDLSAYGAFSAKGLSLARVIGAGVAPQLGAPWLGFATFGGKIWFNLIYWDAFMNETSVKEICAKAMAVLKAAIGVLD